MSLADAACATMYAVTALAKMVFSSEVPIEAPSCWPTVTVADATPASCGATPNVPVLIDGAITMPSPTPVMMMGPSTHQQRGERALAGPRGDQHGEVDRRAADGRHAGEAEQPYHERHLPAE